MAEIISSSQESLPLSEETCKMLIEDLGDSFNTLINDTTFEVGTATHEVLKEKKILEEKLEEVSRVLTEEVNKSNQLFEKLKNEIKVRQDLEQDKLLIEIMFKEELKKREIKIQELQLQLQQKEKELNESHMMCYKEAEAKVEALYKLQELNDYSNTQDFDLQAQAQKQMLEFNEGEIEDLFIRRLQSDPLTNTVLKTPSSLPATENWPGEYNFRVSFPAHENMKAHWVYSTFKNKLYVKKDIPCPINFSTKIKINDFCIRTMPFFSSADHVLDLVHRCVNHSMVEIQNNKPEAEHLVRVESRNAQYETDQNTRRHSVVVPFENPPAGQQFSSYIFKFACFQSCSGGPNRRPLMLCFTLERSGIVVGRQKVHLKICACPVRDSKIEEKSLLNSSENQTKKKAVKREREENDTSQKDFSKQNYDNPVKIRPGPYYLKVDDRRHYDILKFMAKVCTQPLNQPLRRNNLINLIMSNYSSSEDDDKK